MHLLSVLGLFMALLHLSVSLLLGAFNIQALGPKKVSNTDVMDIIVEIIQRYDIILVQEVRDSDLSVTQSFMEQVNKVSPQSKFGYVVSEPLGPSTYKERYLFLYRENTVSVVKSYLYDDGRKEGEHVFNREPFVVMFSSSTTAVENFVLIPQHTSPRVAVKEMDALYDVVSDVRKRWDTDNIVLLGDFNAGCNYVSGPDWKEIRLSTNESFHWLITDQVDTTVSDTKCPYDRIVVTEDMMKGVVVNSAKAYDFEAEMSLSLIMAKAVSDHLPVEVTLSPAA